MQRQRVSGSILLEVILALTLFVAAATVITSGLNTSVKEVERLRLNLHASNLAVSVLSELRMGILPAISANPEPFPTPFEAWTWQLQVTPMESVYGTNSSLQRVEVIIRHSESSLVRRLSQFLPSSTMADDALAEETMPVDYQDNFNSDYATEP